MTSAKTTHKGFTIEIEYMEGEERCDSDISKTICGTFYSASIGCAEFEGLVDADGETISCPQSVIDKAYDLEEEVLRSNGVW